MNKRKLSILFLCVYFAVMILSLASCAGGGDVVGFSVDKNVKNLYYDEEGDCTSLELTVSATNDNSSRSIRSYKFKVVFRDVSGSILESKIYSGYDSLDPYDTASQTYYFYAGDDGVISGCVDRVDVYPVEMSLGNDESNSSASGGDTEWDFWAWFWTIISGILLLLFITCCVGADGDTDAIIGGVIIFLAPAILILFVYFGFFFGA